MGRITRAIARLRHSKAASDVPPSDYADLRAELIETVHERDVSIARAAEAEERARLAGERLGALAGLEHRVEIAERRALDAERRLQEISDQVDAAHTEPVGAPDDGRDGTTDHEPEAESAEPPSASTAELRARLARAAARKHRPVRPE